MLQIKNSKITIYTDGACKKNPGPGGWAAILIYAEQEKIITGSEDYTTNNRMELLSVINALQLLKRESKVDLYTDSQYVSKGISVWLPKWQVKDWKTANGSKVKNQDLWESLNLLVQGHNIHWYWVKAHNGDLYNERVDKLAREAIKCVK